MKEGCSAQNLARDPVDSGQETASVRPQVA